MIQVTPEAALAPGTIMAKGADQVGQCLQSTASMGTKVTQRGMQPAQALLSSRVRAAWDAPNRPCCAPV